VIVAGRHCCKILGKEKAAAGTAARSEDSVVRQNPHPHCSAKDRAAYTRVAAFLRQQARRTTRRAARRPSTLEAAA